MSEKELADEKMNEQTQQEGTVIKIIGVGGAGGSAIKQMISAGLRGQFYSVDTDQQALQQCNSAKQVQLGESLTNGLGTGANSTLGRRAAEDDVDKLKEIIVGSDMVFITAGMGGGTGTGAAPMIAKLAKESNVLTIGVVTKPFEFEGRTRIAQADEGTEELKSASDSTIVIPNQRLLEQVERQPQIREAFKMADNVLLDGVRCISDLITIEGEINLDFADVKTALSEAGEALMSIGIASGANRAEMAAQKAISCPLLEDTSIQGANSILINFTGDQTMTLHEVSEAMDIIRHNTDSDAEVIFGLSYDNNMGENIKITLIATGFEPSIIK